MKPAEGLIVPIITPKLNGNIDTTGLKRVANNLIDHRIDGVFGLSTTGESQYLSLREKKQEVEAIAEANRQRVALVVGVSSGTLSETHEVIGCAEENNADAVVLALLYGQGTEVEKIDLVLSRSKLPVILYNNPAITDGDNISLATVYRLSKNPRIIGIKDSSGDPCYFNALLELADDHFAILQGREELFLESLANGAEGIVSGSANVFPDQFREVIQKRTQAAQNEAIRCKKELEQLSVNPILAVKKKLVQTGMINSQEMFQGR
jgi:dihydrodipicolinate synthase/N-acetylneuraminate lyase